MVGLFYTLLAGIIWVCIPMTVPLEILGKALGVVAICLNSIGTVIPLLLGYIIDSYEDNGWVQPIIMVFAVIATLVVSLGLSLHYFDSKQY